MATAVANGKDLLDVVKQMSEEEFDSFLDQAITARRSQRHKTLSVRETRLIERINRGLSENLRKRYAQLTSKLRKRTLTEEKHQELLKLTQEAESRDADRAAALGELGKLWQIPVRALMKQMGIPAV